MYILIELSFNVVKTLTLENGHLTGQKNNLPGNIKHLRMVKRPYTYFLQVLGNVHFSRAIGHFVAGRGIT